MPLWVASYAGNLTSFNVDRHAMPMNAGAFVLCRVET